MGKYNYIRKTEDIYYIVSKYGTECACYSMKEAKATLQDYKNNVDYAVWIEKHRERIEK